MAADSASAHSDSVCHFEDVRLGCYAANCEFAPTLTGKT
jgi:hypothetical protein